MQAADEFLHNMKMAAQQQSGDYSPFVYGHIASYDAATHRVKLILPSVRDEDGTPVTTAWMPLGTGAAGQGWGIQIAPMGGATTENPTGGELCVVQRLDRTWGVQAVACQIFNQVNAPPFPNLQPGEVGMQSQGGASMLFDKEGNVTVKAVNIVFDGAMISFGALGGAVQALVTSAFKAIFNEHTHSNGANQPPPVNQQMTDAQLTSVVVAE